MADDERPLIIIKKIKKGGHGHHGGAWKVAYADFVTAMMAFFLMLWLLSSVEEAKLDGLAEYFTPTIGLRDSMGIGFEGGATPDTVGIKKSDTAPPSIIPGQTPQGPTPEEPKTALVESEQDAQLFEKAEQEIRQAMESDPNLRDIVDQIIVEQSPEGLKIEVMDSEKHPMFNPGTADLTDHGHRILAKLAVLVEKAPNYISITGHTDSSPMTSRGADYTNWELSADRANSARRFMERSGVNNERTKKVVGMGSAELIDPKQPYAPQNRRITIILLRGSYLDLAAGDTPATRDLLSPPKPGQKPVRDTLKEKQRRAQEEEKKKQQEEILKPKPVITPEAIPSLPASPVNKTPAVTGANPVDALSMPGAQVGSKPEPVKPEAPQTETVTQPPKVKKERTEEDFEGFMDE